MNDDDDDGKEGVRHKIVEVNEDLANPKPEVGHSETGCWATRGTKLQQICPLLRGSRQKRTPSANPKPSPQRTEEVANNICDTQSGVRRKANTLLAKPTQNASRCQIEKEDGGLVD
eukprot:CAMPEP_0206582802 /NCGR_PEP_ID=MMETSP0325_2-20121206/34713_1 /ASSEMBLY_ACC=CAM_ASM_000347 /TAXON_ID=2866 /ORGANISM="Crypthecodinium cohnii, Strain Seligo" /LENGTH=115 /DNA_ID=CAMNT_0054089577 /DNA_START=19 /DNA_END=363 /DNA_ORIENTATION=+